VTTLVDTSALYALLDEDDRNHERAARWLTGPGSDAEERLVTHNYVVVEAAAVVQRRLGRGALGRLLMGLVAGLQVTYVDESLHRSATVALLASGRRRVSMVDWVSFEVMNQERIEQAFAFDRDFASQGFRTVP
jgi:predicted nucleic acid-binding protein